MLSGSYLQNLHVTPLTHPSNRYKQFSHEKSNSSSGDEACCRGCLIAIRETVVRETRSLQGAFFIGGIYIKSSSKQK